jgi:uncharacterized phage protein (TIGR01671 family)
MREFKFRAWDGKQMWHNAFCVTGYGKIQRSEISREWHSWKDENWILMQYTGLKDKNGVEVFEGDMLCGEDEYDGKNFSSCEVFYHDNDGVGDHVGFVMNRVRHYGNRSGGVIPKFLPRVVSKMTIIGNIYENPELLVP